MNLAHNFSRWRAAPLLLARQQPGLAPLDVEDEWLRIGLLLAGALVTALMLALALSAAAATLVDLFWEDAPIAAATGITGFFILSGVLMAWRLGSVLRDKTRLMAATLAQLDPDG
jgi:uncharacterized membrane protein YqjE